MWVFENIQNNLRHLSQGNAQTSSFMEYLTVIYKSLECHLDEIVEQDLKTVLQF